MLKHFPENPQDRKILSGFTLIELSIVLVIIGLIIGGILTGQDLINAATVRAQISQIEKYNTAVRTFQGKYGYLPGDIPNPYATNFGFAARGSYTGEGDGNGLIEGVSVDQPGPGYNFGNFEAAGETAMFWVDLSKAGLIDGTFNTASPNIFPAANVTGATVNSYFPQAKISNSNYVMVDSGGVLGCDGLNYFSISAVTKINKLFGVVTATSGMTVKQAYDMDKKTDDGFPQSGNMVAANNGLYNGNIVLQSNSTCTSLLWASASTYSGSCLTAGMGDCVSATNAPTTVATSGSSLTCYDNGGAGGKQQYSIGQSGGNNMNCGLSMKLQ